MTDIVERLRSIIVGADPYAAAVAMKEAADEIERLRNGIHMMPQLTAKHIADVVSETFNNGNGFQFVVDPSLKPTTLEIREQGSGRVVMRITDVAGERVPNDSSDHHAGDVGA